MGPGVRKHPKSEQDERDAEIDEDLGRPAAGQRELDEAQIALIGHDEGRVDRKGGEDGDERKGLEFHGNLLVTLSLRRALLKGHDLGGHRQHESGRYNRCMHSTATVPQGFGSLLRQWRAARRMSQQQLAIESEVSTRHISYVENGKSSPSREMVLILASALDLPLRERNSLLSAAGFAPVYRESDLAAPEMLPVRQAFDTILAHHEPYPAIVLTRAWDLVTMNDAFTRLFAFLIEPPVTPIVAQNVMHALFHPKGVRPYVSNWEEVAGFLIDRLFRESILELETSESRKLLDALLAYPGVPSRMHEVDLAVAPRVCVTVHLEKEGTRLELFSTLTTLGTPMDVTAQELRIESYFPADEATGDWLRKSAARASN